MNISYLPWVATLALLLLSGSLLSFALRYQRRQHQNRREQERLKTAYEQLILQSQLEIQNQTLQSLGQELHDNIGQLLSVVKINLSVLEEMIERGEAHTFLAQTSLLVNQTIDQVRSLSKTLDKDYIQDFGFVQSLKQECQRIEKTRRFAITLVLLGQEYSLNPQREIILFRVVQEVLSNALKHSKASRIDIVLHFEPQAFIIAIADNGIGLPESLIKQPSIQNQSRGMSNMRKRMLLIEGTCTFHNNNEGGATVILTIPNLGPL